MEEKIKRAIESGRLNLQKTGKMEWNQFFIRITELVWSRNLHDGYKIEVYDNYQRNHLGTVVV